MTNTEIVNEIRELAGVTKGYGDDYDFEYVSTPDGEDESPFILVEYDDWTQDHKYQNRVQIWHYPARDVYFQVYESRSGSYHTDWYYNPPDIDIVTKHEKTVTKVVTEWRVERDEPVSKPCAAKA